MNRSSLFGSRLVAATGAPDRKIPPMLRHLLPRPDQSLPALHHDVYTRPSLPQMNRSSLLGSRLTAATGAPGEKAPPMLRHLSPSPDQSLPSLHHDVYTQPSLPQMNRSSL